MLKSLACTALLAGALSGAALAAEPQPQPTGPVVLGDEQLDRVAAGYTGSNPATGAFFFAHGVLADKVGILPPPAVAAILLLHAPFLNGNN